MLADVIEKIKKSEAEASDIKSAAAARVKAMLADGDAGGKKLVENAESASAAEYERAVSAATEQAEKIKADALAEANALADALRAATSKRLDAASDKIVERIMQKWR